LQDSINKFIKKKEGGGSEERNTRA